VVLSNGTLFSKHLVEYKNAPKRAPKWVLALNEICTASDQSSVRSWLVQPIKEFSFAAGLCAGRGCALIRQLANRYSYISWKLEYSIRYSSRSKYSSGKKLDSHRPSGVADPVQSITYIQVSTQYYCAGM